MPPTESSPLLPATQSSAVQACMTTPSLSESSDRPSSELPATVDTAGGRSLSSRWKRCLFGGLAVMGTNAALSPYSLPHAPRGRLSDIDRAMTQNASVICVETPGDTAVDRVTSDAEWLRPVSHSTYPDPDYTLCTVIPSSQDDRRLNSTLLLKPENGGPIECTLYIDDPPPRKIITLTENGWSGIMADTSPVSSVLFSSQHPFAQWRNAVQASASNASIGRFEADA